MSDTQVLEVPEEIEVRTVPDQLLAIVDDSLAEFSQSTLLSSTVVTDRFLDLRLLMERLDN